MSARETHVTEWGLATCVGLRGVVAFELAGVRPRRRACDGEDIMRLPASGYIQAEEISHTVPTCPRCAVLRDEALEGRLPKRKDAA